MNRRDFISTCAVGSILSYGNLSFSAEKKSKSVIFIWLSGGASSVEVSNPLPEGLDKYRSVRGHIQTKTPGLYLSGDMVNLAGISNELTIVRSMKSRDANHETATMEYLTSQPHIPNQSQNSPSYGSVISSQIGSYTSSGTPNYVKIDKIAGDDAAFLGSSYNGFDLDQSGIDNLKTRVPEIQFERRIKLMNMIDQSRANKDSMDVNWIGIKESAVKVVRGVTSKALDLSGVDQKTQQKYGVGKSNFGKNLLIAKRLVEAGSSYVNVAIGGFDLHSNINEGMARLVPEIDLYIATLIEDLKISGKLSDTLIVINSEFSRTGLNINAGKDHMPSSCCLIFAGGNYNHDRVIGATDKTGLVAETNVFNPKDLCKTILGHFDIKELTITDHQGRPRHIIDNNARNILV